MTNDEIEENPFIRILKRSFYQTNQIELALILFGLFFLVMGVTINLQDQISWQIRELVRWYMAIGFAGHSILFGLFFMITGCISILVKIYKKSKLEQLGD